MSWERVKLGKFLKTRDVRFKPGAKAISGLKRVDKIDFSGNLHLSDTPSKTDMILVKKGDLLVSGINVAKGAVTVYEGDQDIVATIHYSSYEFDPNQIDIEFLKLFLKSPEFLDAIREQVPGGIKTEIKPKHFLPLEILMPTDLIEQKALISYFASMELESRSLTSELTYQLCTVKELRQAFLREAMQGNLIPQGQNDEPASELLKEIKAEKTRLIREKKIKKEKSILPIKPDEIPFEIPESWVWCRLGDVSKLITSGSRDWKKYYSKEGDLFIRSQNIKASHIDLTNRAFVRPPVASEGQRTQVYKDDILITITGAGVSNTALVNYVDWETAYVSQHVSLVRPMAADTAKWIHLALISSFVGKKQFSKLIYGDKPGLNLVQISQLMIPLPPLQEQHCIVTKLQGLMDDCSEIEKSIRQSQMKNELLLQQVLREALQPQEKCLTNEVAMVAEP